MVDIIGTLEILLLSSIEGYIIAAIGLKLFQTRIKKTIFAYADEYVDDWLTQLSEKPEMVEKLLEPVLMKMAGKLMKQYGVPEPGGSGDMRIFGFKIPGIIAQKGMELIGGAIQKKAGQALANPFD